VNCPASMQKELAGVKVMTGSFTGPGNDQLLLAGEKGIILAGFDKTAGPCGKNEAGATLREIWRSDGPAINGERYHSPDAVVPCDLNGDRITELLLVTEGGSWELFRYASKGWSNLARGGENRVGEWDDKYYDLTITAGLFLKGSTQDQLLTVFSDKARKGYAYSLLKYNAAEKKFVRALKGREGNLGLAFGHDTLKPCDRFLFGRFRPDGGTGFLRYTRDWRFDLKEMQFNDSTFVILGNIDFTGYNKDQNPKFYEALKLVPGRITDPSVTSILVIARNREELPYLPNTLAIYSFKQKIQP